MAKNNTKKDYTYATGKRKTASARVRVFKGKGENQVNGKSMEKYFPGPVFKDVWAKPFRMADVMDKYFATVKVRGGGMQSQVEAIAHGIAKALAKIDRDNFRPVLKKSGLLTRDARIRERRKVNTGGKARRVKQSPKR